MTEVHSDLMRAPRVDPQPQKAHGLALRAHGMQCGEQLRASRPPARRHFAQPLAHARLLDAIYNKKGNMEKHMGKSWK